MLKYSWAHRTRIFFFFCAPYSSLHAHLLLNCAAKRESSSFRSRYDANMCRFARTGLEHAHMNNFLSSNFSTIFLTLLHAFVSRYNNKRNEFASLLLADVALHVSSNEWKTRSATLAQTSHQQRKKKNYCNADV